jgi:OHCU decarboxylase
MAAEIAPIDDIRSTAVYRRQIALNLLTDFLNALEPLANFNRASSDEAQAMLAKCCGSSVWIAQLTALRPFSNKAMLFAAADEIWRGLSTDDWLEAFRAHPRIGDSAPKSGSWSAQEQAGMTTAGSDLRAAMASANRAYEERFGFIYIVCATGKTAPELLSILETRLGSAREHELQEAAEQQRRIMQMRLRRWLEE